MRGSGRFISVTGVSGVFSGCFNPLHCGAVVASRHWVYPSAFKSLVSIPFIAGQWSLLFAAGNAAGNAAGFQSPSLRGSGRFGRRARRLARGQSQGVSIPFIAGQWSLPRRGCRHFPRLFLFQSPSLRGSGRFLTLLAKEAFYGTGFNPLHCGAVVASPSHNALPVLPRPAAEYAT